MVNWQKNPDLKDRISRRMIQWIFGVLLFVSGTKVKAEGLENIPKDRAVLYVGNHRSYFDIITSYRLLPGITGYVAKRNGKGSASSSLDALYSLPVLRQKQRKRGFKNNPRWCR